ncbi:MAG: hypothetical protein JSV59_11620 [Flavobacteriaceae bacterium]|nr:MAG: hypothetical protein JSV59_11620 [Flavobacteriaceae bacterium]
MNTNILNFIVTLILALVFSVFLPWWSVMLAAFVSAVLFSLKGLKVFLIPFLAVFLFWTGYAFVLSNNNNFTLAKKIAILLPLDGNPYILILVTGIVGGFAAGMAGIFGKQCRVLVKK